MFRRWPARGTRAEPAQQPEASDGDLADQARAVGPDEIYEAQHDQP